MTVQRNIFKLAAAGVLALGALCAAVSANAGTSWSIGVNVPGVVVGSEPAPTYYAPAPVYSQPAPVYYQPPPPPRYTPPAYYEPAPVYYAPASRWDEERAQRREWRRREWERREHYRRYHEDRD
ncbi:hypothetical protein [Variovorax sp. E3]|uniref:hypothetical protein n=1 Tax=Variovorax sp. E3 TaxID=1914993 RepID=UPI0018DB5509|nr:hypothetical protein [Variovorax sp. E3]